MWDDVEIIDLDTAKLHVRKTSSETEEDDILELYLAQAHGLVLDYVANARDDDFVATMLTWDSDTAPKAVQAAILRQFAELRRYRGDDETADETKVDGNFLSPRVKQLLNLYHDPTLA